MHRVIFDILIILLPTQLGLHFWPDWAMVMGRRVDYLSPTLFLTDILICLTLFSWFISAWPRILGFVYRMLEKKQKKISFADIRYTILYILFFIFASLNIFFSLNKFVAIYHWIKFLEFCFLGFYIVKTKPHVSHVARLLSFSILYSSFIAITQFLLQHSIGGPFWLLGERAFTLDTSGIARFSIGGKELLRAYSTFPHPNVLAGFLAITLPFVIQYAKTKKYFYFFTLLFGFLALAVTYSRSGIIIALLGVGWVLSRKKHIFLVGFLVFFTLLAIFLFHPHEESVVVRGQLQTAAMSIIRSNFFTGVGLGNFLIALPDFIPSRTIYFLQPVHNIYLLVLAETGIIGLTITLLFIWKGISGFVYGIWESKKRIVYSQYTIYITLYTILLFLGFADHYFLTLQQGRLLLTLVFALAYQARR